MRRWVVWESFRSRAELKQEQRPEAEAGIHCAAPAACGHPASLQACPLHESKQSFLKNKTKQKLLIKQFDVGKFSAEDPHSFKSQGCYFGLFCLLAMQSVKGLCALSSAGSA